MNVDQIETFLVVVDEQSFTRAAIKLNMTQPAVSARIHVLEKSLGRALLTRRGPSFTLTVAGQRLLPRAREMVALSRRIRDEQLGSAEVDSVLRIGANTISQLILLPRALRQFLPRMPRTSLRVEIDRSVQLARMLSEGQLDIALVDHDLAYGLTSQLWSCALPASLVLPERLADGRAVVSAAEVANTPFVAFTAGPAWRDLRNFEKLTGCRLNVVAESSSARVVMQFVAEGVGAAVFPRAALDSAPSEGIAAVAVDGWRPQPWRIDLVCRPGTEVIPEAARMLDILRASRTGSARRRPARSRPGQDGSTAEGHADVA